MNIMPLVRTVAVGVSVALLGSGGVVAQTQPEIDSIKEANQGFYAAISARNAEAVERVWDHGTQAFNIFAVSKAPMLGWQAVKAGYDDLFKRFLEISVDMPTPSIRQNGDSAVVVGVETQKARLQSGDYVTALLPATNIFMRQNGQWLMVHHHSSRPPQ